MNSQYAAFVVRSLLGVHGNTAAVGDSTLQWAEARTNCLRHRLVCKDEKIELMRGDDCPLCVHLRKPIHVGSVGVFCPV